MKRAYKSHLRRQRRNKERYEVCLRACCDGQSCTFHTPLSDKSEVSEIKVRDLSPPEQLRLLRRETMRLLQSLPRKGKYRKRKALKNRFAEIPPWKYDRYTEMWQEADVSKLFRQNDPSLFWAVILKAGMSYARQRSLRKQMHNLFLLKMREDSGKTIKWLPDKQKTSLFFGGTAHFIYLCIDNKSCLKRQQIQEVQGI